MYLCMYIYIGGLWGLERPCGSPEDREIDFDFVFVFVSCRASGRGEAVWVRDARASLTLGLGVRICPAPRGHFWAYFCAQVRGFF